MDLVHVGEDLDMWPGGPGLAELLSKRDGSYFDLSSRLELASVIVGVSGGEKFSAMRV